jgi:hypothetical protein
VNIEDASVLGWWFVRRFRTRRFFRCLPGDAERVVFEYDTLQFTHAD